MTGTKRKSDTSDDDEGSKRVKLTGKARSVVPSRTARPIATALTHEEEEPGGERNSKEKDKSVETSQPNVQDERSSVPNRRVVKLAPPRPFPTVPTSVSATGPRSAHTEGKNQICVTRKTPLGAYLRRCKDVILKDGYKTLHLSALGAAIPLAIQLSLSLPTILPHDPEEIHTEVLTGTVEVKDELTPEDEEEDITYRTRGKSSISIIMKIGDGVDEVRRHGKNKTKKTLLTLPRTGARSAETKKKGKQKGRAGEEVAVPERIVIRADDME